MTRRDGSGRAGRRARWAGPCLLVGVVVALLAATVGLIATYSVLLDRMSRQVEQAQARSANLANADREILVLLQAVTALGRDGDPAEIDIRRGVVGRQLVVAVAAFDQGDPQVAALQDVRTQLAGFPWDRLVDGGGRDDELRRSAAALVAQAEEQVNAIRSAQEKHFYAVTTSSLAANQRSQFALAVLVVLVLGLGALGIATVLRRSRVAEEALQASEAWFRSLVQRASDLTIVTDGRGVVTYASPAVEAFVGHRPAELHGRSLLDYVEPDERSDVAAGIALLAEHPGLLTIELRLCTRDGRVRSVEAVCQNLVDDPAVAGLVWNGRDVTERRVLEDELTHRAHHDPLTGLPNRVLLLRRLADTLADPASTRAPVGVAVIDLDGFKIVNDTLGHPAGDELLQIAAQRLLGCVRDGDLVARLGGDEFAVLMTGPDREHAVAIARRMVDVLHEPLVVSGHHVTVGASIGVADAAGRSAEDLLADADIAMYGAKRSGKGRVEVFEPEMRVQATHRTRLQQELAQAVERGEIDVVYQPVVDLHTERPVVLEALARWHRPGRPPVPPEVFIALAEESGAIDAIGAEVLRQACHAAQGWRHLPGYAELGIAVNVSVHQIRSRQLVDQVVSTLRASGLPPTLLVLEMTESAALGDCTRVAAELARLQALGVRIAVDDFGAGYSSLGLLTGLDADGLKIDRSLLDFDTTRRGSLVAAIAELGHTLGLRVVAEGVETPGHLQRAREARCDSVQGFHLSRPLPEAEVAEFLTTWTGAVLRSGTTVTGS